MVENNLTTDQKNALIHFLLAHSTMGVPRKGAISDAVSQWNVSRQTVSLWWHRAKDNIEEGEVIHMPSRYFGNKNRAKIVIDRDKIMNLPKKNRGSLEKLAKKLGVGYGTVQRWVKNGELKRHNNSIHPNLTEDNKLKRLIFSLKSTYVNTSENLVKFKDMSSHIHMDEKWFFLTKTTERYYLLPEEDVPYRSCQSKSHITKVMFMSAVTRPLFGPNGEVIFDGKIGIFPFIEEQPAIRSSRNREAGTLVTKPIISVTKEIIKDCLITKIIPAIKAKWPPNASKDIWIQQDNAKPHIQDTDSDFRAAAHSDGFNIRLIFQPPNSPDLNINDLGFFRSIQSLQHETAATTVCELVAAVEGAFALHLPYKLNYNFLTLQTVMVEIMKCRGHNNFGIPHMKKRVLQNQDMLPIDLNVDPVLVSECLDYLIQQGEIGGLEYLIDQMEEFNFHN